MLNLRWILPFSCILSLLLCSCSEERKFDRTRQRILKQWPPKSAALWPEDLNPEECRHWSEFIAASTLSLRRIEPEALSAEHKQQFGLLQQQLLKESKFQQHLATDPSVYNLPGHWSALLSNPILTNQQKHQHLKEELPLAPAYYHRAREKLYAPDIQRLEIAIEKHIGGIAFLNTELYTFMSQHPQTKIESLQEAKNAVREYIAWCNSRRVQAIQKTLKKDK